jgi:hypothetical protein
MLETCRNLSYIGGKDAKEIIEENCRKPRRKMREDILEGLCKHKQNILSGESFQLTPKNSVNRAKSHRITTSKCYVCIACGKTFMSRRLF